MQITDCKMPNLAKLNKEKILSIYLSSSLVGIGRGADDRRLDRFKVTYSRLIDKAIYEYCLVQEDVINEIEEPKRSIKELQKGRNFYAHLIMNNLENCINSIRRLFNILDKLNGAKYYSLDKLVKRSINFDSKKIIGMRNMIEHLDKDIFGNKIIHGDPIAPIVSNDASSIQISDVKIKTAELAYILERLHDIGKQVSTL